MVSKNPAPQPPSAVQTAAAQTGSNVSTAIANQQLNAVNQVGPDGSSTYSQTGTYDFTDPSTGQTYKLPQLTQTTTLSPEQAALKATGQQTSQNLANLGKSQSERLSGLLATPFSLDNNATEARLMELGRKRLDPLLEQRQASLDTKLSNQGIKLGSAAYDRAQALNGQQTNDAYNSLILNGRNTAVQEALLQRNQPLNEIIGLTSGTQIGTPSFGGTPQTQIAGTDIAGLTNNQYNQQIGQWNQQQAANQNLLGGLFGLGANAALAFSDRRLKSEVRQIGRASNGLPLYRYMIDGHYEIGFMADEVAELHPDAVHKHPSGFDMVDYEKAVA